MTFLLLQAFLLMMAAYFLGAMIGCGLRQTFVGVPDRANVRSTERAIAATAATGALAGIDVPQSEPLPIQPRIEYVEPPDGLSDATRFERALSGVGSMEHAETVHRDSFEQSGPATPDAEAPTYIPTRPVVRPAERQEPPAPTAASVVPPAPTRAIAENPAPKMQESPAAALAAAAAAAAAAMANAARTKTEIVEEPSPQPPPPVYVPPLPPEPAAAEIKFEPSAAFNTAGGLGGTRADVRIAEDLTLIRGIDARMAETLMGQGVLLYRDIAAWTRRDVDAVSRAIAGKGRVERENWVEQAALLATGALTEYARRRRRGEVATATPSAPLKPRISAANPAASVVSAPGSARQAQRVPASTATAAAAAIAAASAAAARGGAVPEKRASTPPAITPIEPSPPMRPARLADAIRDKADKAPVAQQPAPPPSAVPEAGTSPHRGDVVGLRSIRSEALRPPTVDVQARVGAGARSSGAADDLKRIRGIGVLIEKKLNALGVSSYDQIANWTSEDIERVSRALDFRGRIERENWVEQARILSAGGATDFSRRLDRGDVS